MYIGEMHERDIFYRETIAEEWKITAARPMGYDAFKREGET